MRLFCRFLRAQWRGFGLLLLCGAVFGVSFALYHLPLAAVLYPVGLCALLLMGYMVCRFLRFRHRYAVLTALRARTEAMLEGLPAPDDPEQAAYQAILQAYQAQSHAQQARDRMQYQDRMEYYTVWAHQIKTPIASMKLTLQQEDSPLARKLGSELLRIEQYVDMALAYLRLDSESSDYVFREHALDDLIRQAVRRFAPEFIGRKLRLDYTPVDGTVVTDEKWFVFVLEQVLSNALKYTREGGIRITLEEPKLLCIQDTGIGIAAEDLPRIFEKGYTGLNGRSSKSASGLGLYLCSRVCTRLGIGISAASEIGVGTTIRLDLSQWNRRLE